MKWPVSILLLLTVLFFVFLKEREIRPPQTIEEEGCIRCHSQVTDPDPSHPIKAFKCFSCHLGNPYSLDKERAHTGMVKNPGDLLVINWTCGKSKCHADIADRVKKGVMATNRGIIDSLNVEWEEGASRDREVRDLQAHKKASSPGIDLYRKMCGGCHLWKERGDRPGEAGLRGGGCSDCHVIDKNKGPRGELRRFVHSEITTRIPSENCVKCHNRSARIGLSYFGKHESPRYGTPYKGSGFSDQTLSGRRYFLNIIPDVHWEKAGMDCIDCHTGTGLMGDGHSYSRMEDQVDITCRACHWPDFRLASDTSDLAVRLQNLNRVTPSVDEKVIGVTRKKTPIYNLQLLHGKIFFFRKRDGKAFEIKTSWFYGAEHRFTGHKRLSCQACHSAWIPQCYGCHTLYYGTGKQRDWLTGQQTKGRWVERRSYMRFERPSLALRFGTQVFPVSPCQVFVYPESQAESGNNVKRHRIFTISAFDPHTTRKKSRTCDDCHGKPKSLGLGNGTLSIKDGKWSFVPIFKSNESGIGVDFPIDGFVDLSGRPTHKFARSGGRAFNKTELEKILTVSLCTGCHDNYKDPIYRDFETSLKRFESDKTLPCTK